MLTFFLSTSERLKKASEREVQQAKKRERDEERAPRQKKVRKYAAEAREKSARKRRS